MLLVNLYTLLPSHVLYPVSFCLLVHYLTCFLFNSDRCLNLIAIPCVFNISLSSESLKVPLFGVPYTNTYPLNHEPRLFTMAMLTFYAQVSVSRYLDFWAHHPSSDLFFQATMATNKSVKF